MMSRFFKSFGAVNLQFAMFWFVNYTNHAGLQNTILIIDSSKTRNINNFKLCPASCNDKDKTCAQFQVD